MRKRQWYGLLLLLGLLPCMSLAAIPSVSAHARFQSSEPADKAVLTTAPTQALLTFTAPTNPTKSGGTVTDASGATVSTGFRVDPGDGTKMTIQLKPNLPNGVYTVKWDTLAEDDNGMVDGTLSFTVQAAPPSSGTAPAAAAVTSQGNGATMTQVLLIVTIVCATITIFAAGIAIGTRAQRSSGASERM